jgi:outer membrane PBP1 activator LpoA protein
MNLYKLVLLLFAVIFLDACVGIIKIPKPIESKPTKPTQPVQRQVSGDYLTTASTYLRMAKTTQPPQSHYYRIKAVELLLKISLWSDAKKHLQQIPVTKDNVLQTRVEFASIELALGEQLPLYALKLLNNINEKRLSVAEHKYYYILKAAVLEANGKLIEAVKVRIYLDNLLQDTFEQRDNSNTLWDNLLRLSVLQLKSHKKNTDYKSKIINGWLDLAIIVKTSKTNLEKNVNKWRKQYLTHPANLYIVNNLHSKTFIPNQPKIKQVKQIALLLPLSGKFAQVSNAIYEGFMASWYEANEHKYNIRVYDIYEQHIREIYQKAVENGADFIIGPLEKDKIKILLNNYTDFPVPTLVLNRTTENKYPNLYQFSLLPEDEVIAIANKALSDGHIKSVALVPDNEWGKRVLNTFTKHWQKHGGTLLGQNLYKSQNYKSFSKTVKTTVKGLKPDLIFVAGFPTQMRLIVPNIRFYTRKLPIYTTSHVYSGIKNSYKDKDLNNVNFVGMPWIFNPNNTSIYANLQQNSADMKTPLKRFYAFGIDAYNLINYLKNPTDKLFGETGILSIDNSGIIHRKLMLVKFINGKAKLLKKQISNDAVIGQNN